MSTLIMLLVLSGEPRNVVHRPKLVGDDCAELRVGVVVCASPKVGALAPGIRSDECAELRNGTVVCASVKNERGEL